MTPTKRTSVVRLSDLAGWLGIVLAVCHSAILVFFAADRPDIGPPPSAAAVAAGTVFVDPYHSSASVIAGRSFHFAGEPILLKAVYLLDLPTLLASVALSLLARAAGFGLHIVSWVFGVSWLLLGAFQWLYVGSFLAAYPAARSHRPHPPRTAA